MKKKQAMMLAALAMLACSGNVLAQGAKPTLVSKEVTKKPNANLQTQALTSNKSLIKKSFNPDSPEFLGVPLTVKDPNRP